MTPGEAYWVGRPAEETRNPVVVSHRPIVNSNLPVSYLCIQPERWVAATAWGVRNLIPHRLLGRDVLLRAPRHRPERSGSDGRAEGDLLRGRRGGRQVPRRRRERPPPAADGLRGALPLGDSLSSYVPVLEDPPDELFRRVLRHEPLDVAHRGDGSSTQGSLRVALAWGRDDEATRRRRRLRRLREGVADARVRLAVELAVGLAWCFVAARDGLRQPL